MSLNKSETSSDKSWESHIFLITPNILLARLSDFQKSPNNS